MPLANEIVRRLADKMNGTPESMLLEVLGDTSSTAHILGGATMGRTPEDGVCDELGRVFGYQNMYVCDGSLVPANLGVNPSLTITALSEYVMHHVPPKEGADRKPAPRP
jgi:cholesterol oxidase